MGRFTSLATAATQTGRTAAPPMLIPVIPASSGPSFSSANSFPSGVNMIQKHIFALAGVVLIAGIVGTSTPSLANCYVIRNTNRAGNLNLSFQWPGPVGSGTPLSAVVLPGQQYPLGGGQWCVNAGSVTVLTSGPGHLRAPNAQLWHGALVFGTGGPTSAPPGTYTVGPP